MSISRFQPLLLGGLPFCIKIDELFCNNCLQEPCLKQVKIPNKQNIPLHGIKKIKIARQFLVPKKVWNDDWPHHTILPLWDIIKLLLIQLKTAPSSISPPSFTSSSRINRSKDYRELKRWSIHLADGKQRREGGKVRRRGE